MDAPKMTPCVSLPLKSDLFQDLVLKAKDWALMHGASMRSRNNFSYDSVVFAPFILIPSSFPRKEFQKAKNVQTILNELFHLVAHDRQFLTETLRSTIEVDEFTNRLFQLYETVSREGVEQNIDLGLFRSDYLLDASDNNTIKQVEFNTISVSFAGACTQVTNLNRFVLRELDRGDLLQHLPENKAVTGLCEGLIEGWKIYNKKKTAILFVVEDISYNICDQRFHEFEIRRLYPEIAVIRKTLTEVFDQGHMTEKKELIVNDVEIALVYFRAGYEPSHYHGEKEWEARLLIERSKAIKCPSIHYQLAGTKKVQQALARPNVLEKFLNDSSKVEVVREIFTGIYSLDFDKFGNEAIEMALREPEKFVLKPQREGGGNNVYGAHVKHKVEEMINSQERTAWILMKRIIPPVQLSYIIRAGTVPKFDEMQEIVSELGVFGIIIGDSNNILLNKEVGHMLRTKLSTADEGGVAAGDGCLDSPFLVD